MVDDIAIGSAIKALRIAAGLSQVELAERLDYTPNYISLVENGRRGVSIEGLNAFAAEFQVPSTFILFSAEMASPGNDNFKLVESIKKLIKGSVQARAAIKTDEKL